MWSRASAVLALATLTVVAACDNNTAPKKAGPPAKLSVVSGDMQEGTVGQELADPLVVQVTDAAGTPVRGQLVNFRVTKGGGSVFAGANLTDANGIAKERWTLGTST